MKVFTHPANLALAASMLCCLALIGPLLSPTHMLAYHLSWPVGPILATVAINWAALWLLLVSLICLAQKPSLLAKAPWLLVLLVLPWLAAKNAALLAPFPFPHLLSGLFFLAPAILFLTVLRLRRLPVLVAVASAQRFAAVLLGFVSLVGWMVALQLAWAALNLRNLNPPFEAPQPAAHMGARPPGRIVWLLLDELSYQQVYERRFSGVSLPAFDRLAAGGTVFTHVIPAGVLTQRIVPSLLTGTPVGDLRVSTSGMLKSLYDPASGQWVRFDPRQTVFADAQAAGYSTAVAGWYNPYCRILAPVLDHCFWVSRDPLGYLWSPIPWPAIITAPARLVFSYFKHDVDSSSTAPIAAIEAESHAQDYRDLNDAADHLLRDPSVTFLFLHMPVPHPPGIFERSRGVFTQAGSSYLDNLVLADRYLAHVRELLEKQGQWDSSLVLVMGDHSWRTFSWSRESGWTGEDNQASRGAQFDDRPGYVIKLAMQQDALRIDTPFRAIETRSLLEAFMTGRLQSGPQLQTWVSQHR